MSSVIKLLAAPDGSVIDITVRSVDRQSAERWIAAFREAHGLRDRPQARPNATLLERAIARAFPLLGWTMAAFMAAAVIVVLAYLAGLVEPEPAGAYIGCLLMLAGPLVALVIVLIGVEARIRRPDARPCSGGKRHAGVLAVGMAILAGALLADAPPALADGLIDNECGPLPCGQVTRGTTRNGSSCIVSSTWGIWCGGGSTTGPSFSSRPPGTVDSGTMRDPQRAGEFQVLGTCEHGGGCLLTGPSRGTLEPADPADEAERPLLPPLAEEGMWV